MLSHAVDYFSAGLITAIGLAGLIAFSGWFIVRRRNLDRWIVPYFFPAEARLPDWRDESTNVFLAVCDHFEPCWGKPSRSTSRDRVQRWRTEYPTRFEQFSDEDGRPPQHTFFFPAEEYAAEYLDPLAELCRLGFGDVEVHLHHDNDTADGFRNKLCAFRDVLSDRHGLLHKNRNSGHVEYGFIHGNWALCNSRRGGRWCGVSQELSVLKETGCYAEFSMPSAPVESQTSTINSIYYARDQPGKNMSHDRGIRARVGQPAVEDALLMIQGPLLLDWYCRSRYVFPRIENGDLSEARLPDGRRMELWLKAGVHVAGCPQWRFIKLHTHGCAEADGLLSSAFQEFHNELSALRRSQPNLRLHYVTAWEMAHLVHQAEAGARTPDFSSFESTPDISQSAGHHVA